ncbi:Nudix (Nucleoside diphosphate linked moiety X)-type motif 1 [Gonapodya sp. JEL0774]|nr:Nudix (Nucleoside diphosphate linked moiety X)-type motif 1 [Gonapodya sp. JEL0774]
MSVPDTAVVGTIDDYGRVEYKSSEKRARMLWRFGRNSPTASVVNEPWHLGTDIGAGADEEENDEEKGLKVEEGRLVTEVRLGKELARSIGKVIARMLSTDLAHVVKKILTLVFVYNDATNEVRVLYPLTRINPFFQDSPSVMSLIYFASTQVLLGLKKRGFGCGLWNGFGGKVERGETILGGAMREVREECGLVTETLEKVGINYFTVSIIAVKGTGHIRESDEMAPKWWKVPEIPYASMWVDDPLWYPHLFARRHWLAKFDFGDLSTVLDHHVQVVDAVPDEFRGFSGKMLLEAGVSETEMKTRSVFAGEVAERKLYPEKEVAASSV